MRNLEFKARLADPEAALTRALALGAERAADLRQTDTYFGVANGRLKLRETAGREAELIHYERDESSDRRGSDYGRVPLAEPAALRELMGRALGVSAVVRKRRQLLLLDTTTRECRGRAARSARRRRSSRSPPPASPRPGPRRSDAGSGSPSTQAALPSRPT